MVHIGLRYCKYFFFDVLIATVLTDPLPLRNLFCDIVWPRREEIWDRWKWNCWYCFWISRIPRCWIMQSMWWPNCIIWYSSTNRGVTICICKFEMFKFSIVSYKLPFHFWNIGIWKRNGSRAELANHWSFLFELHWSFQFLTIDWSNSNTSFIFVTWICFIL